jgi:hypothetical protein
MYQEPQPSIINRPPIYVSLTSIYQNQDKLYDTLLSIKNQSLKPSRIYVYLSKDPFLLDKGFANGITNKLLENELKNPIYKLKWTKNEGSYRKLIPILKEKWLENCIIITVDDDVIYDTNLVEKLYYDFLDKGCSIAYRGFMSKKIPSKYQYSLDRKGESLHLYNFATGKGGILYCPHFFHKTGNSVFDSSLYLSDKYKTKDDVWFYLKRIENNIELFLGVTKWLKFDNSSSNESLSISYNSFKSNTEALNS